MSPRAPRPLPLSRCVPQHTLETALLSASQEIELGSGNPAAMQSVIQQRDLLQSGLLSTCRELTRVSAVKRPMHSHTGLGRARTLSVAPPNTIGIFNALCEAQTDEGRDTVNGLHVSLIYVAPFIHNALVGEMCIDSDHMLMIFTEAYYWIMMMKKL